MSNSIPGAARVRAWLTSRLSKLLVPAQLREDIFHLVAAAESTPVVPPLVKRPGVGATVTLARFDPYMHRAHAAVPGSIGVVTRHSRCTSDDDGVLVDWGTGGEVRCDLSELTYP
ncbi:MULTISPECIES: hypothetical protein [unclassified Microbacterium]|uniref:hypothetical protein n=1 Tax=unclassified Microbacterium TaxID=2609290 RepID=UPI002882E9C7|nr:MULTISPECIES: hypothetical protein [unclassified Microbacterium]